MTKFNKKERATRFFIDGKECIVSADMLYHDKSRGKRSQYGILLIHGIELLLKSYLLIKNTSLPDEGTLIDDYLKKLGHKYKNIYKECKKYGDEITTSVGPSIPFSILEIYLDSLSNTYYADSVKVRYIQESETILFDPTVFSAIEGHLIKPLHNIFFPKKLYTGMYY